MTLRLFCVLFTLYVSVSQAQKLVVNAEDLEKTYGKVIFVSMLFRHGDRTVDKSYPNDPYPIYYWVDGLMQLTKVGKEHAYELGEWSRTRYQSLMKPYRYNFLTMNSSDTDRTLMSAELFLAGMFPPSEEEMWNHENLHWQPIPVHTVPSSCDNVISLRAPCEKYELEKQLVNQSPDFTGYFTEHKDIFDYVARHSGISVSIDDVMTSVNHLWDLYDTLFIEDTFNLTLPDWTKKVYPQPLKSVAEFFFSTNSYSHEMRRIKGGPLVKSMIEDMKKKQANSNWYETFHFYSGHDLTVSVLLNTLGVFNGFAPPYCAAVIVELREKDSDYFVTVLYKNSSIAEPYLMNIPGCPNPCTLDNFIDATKSVVPTDWSQECDIGFLMRLYYYTYLDVIVLVCIAILLVGLLVVIVKLHCTRRRRYKHYRTIADGVLNNYNNNSE